jgi:hypothetical protein
VVTLVRAATTSASARYLIHGQFMSIVGARSEPFRGMEIAFPITL